MVFQSFSVKKKKTFQYSYNLYEKCLMSTKNEEMWKCDLSEKKRVRLRTYTLQSQIEISFINTED